MHYKRTAHTITQLESILSAGGVDFQTSEVLPEDLPTLLWVVTGPGYTQWILQGRAIDLFETAPGQSASDAVPADEVIYFAHAFDPASTLEEAGFLRGGMEITFAVFAWDRPSGVQMFELEPQGSIKPGTYVVFRDQLGPLLSDSLHPAFDMDEVQQGHAAGSVAEYRLRVGDQSENTRRVIEKVQRWLDEIKPDYEARRAQVLAMPRQERKQKLDAFNAAHAAEGFTVIGDDLKKHINTWTFKEPLWQHIYRFLKQATNDET